MIAKNPDHSIETLQGSAESIEILLKDFIESTQSKHWRHRSGPHIAPQ